MKLRIKWKDFILVSSLACFVLKRKLYSFLMLPQLLQPCSNKGLFCIV